MRSSASLLATLAFTALACSDDGTPTPPRPVPSDEVPRAEVELLVRRFSPAGVLSHYTMAPDGSRVSPLEGLPEGTLDVVPSPDGGTLALLRASGWDVHLWLMDRWSGALEPVLEGERVVHAVAWSPDGARLAVAQSTFAVTEDVFVMARDGSGAVNLTPDALPAVSFDRTPAWSPDGSTIALTSDRSGQARLWLVEPGGGNLRQAVPGLPEPRERDPAWSPDGQWLAFRADVPAEGGGTTSGLGRVRADGSRHQVFPLGGRIASPAWSPDGRLLFASDATWDWEIRALDPDTGDLTNLTRHLAHDVAVRTLRWAAPPAWAGLEAPVSYDAGAAGAVGLAAGDVDADGRADLVVLAPEPVGARVLRGRAGEGLEVVGGLEAPAGARGVAVADVSNDGVDDVVLLGAEELRVLRGSTGGTGVPTLHALTGEAVGLAALDFGQDLSVEVAAVVARGGEAPFRAQLHGTNGEGDFIHLLDAPYEYAGAVATCGADATGDGYPDVVTLLTGAGTSVVVAPGLGPSLAAPLEAAAGLGLAQGDVPACADLDGDRRDDLVILRPGTAGGLTVLRWEGEALGAPEALPVPGTGLAAADLDRDGDVDLAVADPAAGAVTFVRNRGDGTFAPPVAWPVAGAPSRVLAADLDGDGWQDLAVVGADGDVRVLRNRGR